MGSEQQFCLRWNNHQSTLISVFDTLLESETLVDVTLAAEGQYLKAHKVVLSACSQYFQELLCHHLEKHPIIILKDVTFQELKALIDYMYRGEVNVSQEQLSALIKTAESLKIKGLADGGDRRPDRKSVPQLSPPLPPVLGPALSGNLSLDNRSMGAGEYATNSPLQHGPREGSISPVSRKRKRIRRRSGEGVAGGGAHEGEVGGGSEQASSSASTLSVPNIPATITPVNSGSRTTPGDGDGGDDEGVAGSKLDGGQEDGVQGPASSKQTKSEPGTSLQSHSRTPLLEPKSEYREEDDDDGEADEDSMDNVVALDEDVMDMEGSRDDGLDQKAGPSHGAEVSGQGSGFAPWHMMPDRSGDDIFIPSQESAAQRESQDEDGEAGRVVGRSARWGDGNAKPQSIWCERSGSDSSAGGGVKVKAERSSSPSSLVHTTPHPEIADGDSAYYYTASGRKRPKSKIKKKKDLAGELLDRMHLQLLHPRQGMVVPETDLAELVEEVTEDEEDQGKIGGVYTAPLFPLSSATSKESSSFGQAPRRHSCAVCGKAYQRKDSLQRHVRWECGKEPQFQCPYCPQRSKHRIHVVRHIRRVHENKAS
ncbi:longitudinals lacking protein, isoforms F/I/K/T isoform X3 [Ischnura elegans]|uniref:longitudinals lacking protein, isoforms F/I/K/T isoform X3 n=1 Tax=Ischnura elegans TaxID=197161 RepID=UPI001ED891A2|nr:longitudinals lacking protein, isoforms F/I/K/T isoform X3 [Ischnura elegans]